MWLMHMLYGYYSVKLCEVTSLVGHQKLCVDGLIVGP